MVCSEWCGPNGLLLMVYCDPLFTRNDIPTSQCLIWPHRVSLDYRFQSSVPLSSRRGGGRAARLRLAAAAQDAGRRVPDRAPEPSTVRQGGRHPGPPPSARGRPVRRLGLRSRRLQSARRGDTGGAQQQTSGGQQGNSRPPRRDARTRHRRVEGIRGQPSQIRQADGRGDR